MGLLNSSSNHAVLSNPSKIDLPVTFNAYTSKLKSRVTLGTSDKSSLYVADFPKAGFHDIVMYNGLDADAGALAILKPHNIGKRSTVHIPPLGTGSQPIQEEFRTEKNFFSEAYSFAVAVGRGADTRPEKFEWQSTGFGRKTYKLVCLSSRQEEVVAEWSYDKLGGLRSKVASFTFMGRGATGELGYPFALMSVITFLRILQMHMQAAIGVAVAT